MKTHIENPIDKKLIDDAISEILQSESVADNIKQKLRESDILIITENEVNIYAPDKPLLKKAYEEGLAAKNSNVLISGKLHHLIVLNIANIQSLKLKNEICAIVAHELGHIYNDAPQRSIPSFLDNPKPTLKDIEAVRKENSMQREFYADYFTKVLGCHEALIRSLAVFLESPLSIKVKEQIEERMKKLRDPKQKELSGMEYLLGYN